MPCWARTVPKRYVFLSSIQVAGLPKISSLRLCHVLQSETLKSQSTFTCIVRGEAGPSYLRRHVVDFIVASAHAKAARIEANVEELSVADSVDDAALEA